MKIARGLLFIAFPAFSFPFLALHAQTAFAQGSKVQSSQVCVCDCVYPPKLHISALGYFELKNGGDCSSLNRQACIGWLRKESYRGSLAACKSGPVPLSGSVKINSGHRVRVSRQAL